MQPLPIDTILPQIVGSLSDSPNLVIEAPPGAGKTTRVPRALLDARITSGEEVWVLEPRRLAARLSARRVAEELGEQLGETVGYQVRFEEIASPATRVRFVTEGVLTRRLLRDPQLTQVGAIVLDEFHERHLQADLALALLRRLQRESRPDLKLIVMSATLEAAPVARFLDDCPTLRSEGRRFAVAIEHLARHDDSPLAMQVLTAMRRLLSEGLDGDVLVFLPGAGEIRRAQEACAPLAAEHNLLMLPLHGELPAAEQDRAVQRSEQRKVILSTNVAETSVTIEGVVAVIDSGLARSASRSPWSGLSRLDVGRVSRASAVQRAGRAGRTQPGRALRLYTEHDFNLRPEHEAPEVERLDLAEAVLELHAAGISDTRCFDWFQPPPAESLNAAESLLRSLGAIGVTGEVTLCGKRMLRLPLHPRLSRLVVEAEARGVVSEGCVLAALISERDIRSSQILTAPPERTRHTATKSSPSDLLELLDLFAEAERAGFAAERLRRMNLSVERVRTVDRTRRQLQRICQGRRSENTDGDASVLAAEREKVAANNPETELLISILAGYPDRVAQRRIMNKQASAKENELLLANGGGAELAPESVVRQSEFLVAVEAEERRPTGRGGGRVVVRTASGIEPDWLLDLFTAKIEETDEVLWNAEAERVEIVRRLMYESLVLDERRVTGASSANATSVEASRVLMEAAMEAGLRSFVETGDVERFAARANFIAREFSETGARELGDEDVRESLAAMCVGRSSFAELREAARGGELLRLLRGRLTPEQQRLLPAMAPERVTIGRSRQVRINYERDKPPWIASRLQDFFGMREAPRVAGGRVALVLHLLAPNNRPVQVTSDLAGFWTRHYPQVRRELSRRYPRHDWREDPLGA